jgi:hypothetical protein
VYAQLIEADVPYGDWVILDAMARRLERRMLAAGIVHPDRLPVDQAADLRNMRASRDGHAARTAAAPELRVPALAR